MAVSPAPGGFAASEKLRKAYLRDLARIESDAAQSLVATYQTALDRITRDLDAKLGALHALMLQGEDPAAALTRVMILDEQRAFVKSQIDRFATSAATTLDSAGISAAHAGIAASSAELAGLGSDIFAPNQGLIEQIAARSAPGTALATHLGGMSEQVAQSVMSELVQGAISGTNPRVVQARIQGALAEPVPHLQTLVRTETLGAAREAQLETYRANRDVVKGWIWNAQQDRRTCAVCWSKNGSEHSLAEQFSTHPNCRCTPVARTITYDEILGEKTGITETSPQPFNGDSVFRRQPYDVRLAVLGPSKYAAYESGQLPDLSVLVARTTHPKWGPGLRERTLGELGLPRVLAVNLEGEAGLDARILQAAKGRVRQARRDEPAITRALRGGVEGTGGKLEGLKYRVKDAESLARKVKTEMSDYAARIPPVAIGIDDAIGMMGDVNRYTVILPLDGYTDGVASVVGRLRAEGYTFPEKKWKNTWAPGSPYRGLNTRMVSPDGTPIEVQFHTRESFDTKMASHKPYEEARKDTTTPQRREQLNREMAEAAAKVTPPPGWEQIMAPPTGTRAAARPSIDVLDANAFGKYSYEAWESDTWRDNGVPVLDRLQTDFGYDAKPRVISRKEFDAIASKTRIGRLYRGLGDTDELSATTMIRDFKHGKLYAGKGVHGNGTYATPDREIAFSYAREAAEDYGKSHGSIMHFTISDDARVLDIDDLRLAGRRDVKKDGKWIQEDAPDGKYAREYAAWEAAVKKAMGNYPRPEIYTLITANPSYFAMAKGYDVIRISFPNGNPPYYIILNRGKVIIRDAEDRVRITE